MIDITDFGHPVPNMVYDRKNGSYVVLVYNTLHSLLDWKIWKNSAAYTQIIKKAFVVLWISS